MSKKKLILAIGDSLTCGFYFRGYKHRPYSIHLQELINSYKSKKFDSYLIESYGISGECTISMKPRMKKILDEAVDTRKMDVSHIIILGGTNDCGYQKGSDHVFDNLKDMMEHALKKNKETLIFSCQVPTNEFDLKFPDYRGRKKGYNKKLIEYCGSTDRVHTVHLGDFEKMSEEERKKFWDSDKLHYTAEGYDMLADRIFDVLKEHL